MAENVNLDPISEFDEPAAAPVAPVAPASPPPDAALSRELAELKSELAQRAQEINNLRSETAIVNKLKEVFSDKAIDPRDAYVRKEITRLLPELQDLDKVRQLMPIVLETLGASHEERIAERASTAVEATKSLMKTHGLNPDDEDAVGYMEEILTREIKKNPELQGLWARGQIKAAVGKAFDKASGKLFAPVRANTKRSAVDTITGAPKASPRGAAPSPGASAPRAVDPSDSSRQGIRAVHDAAFDRLQELLDH